MASQIWKFSKKIEQKLIGGPRRAGIPSITMKNEEENCNAVERKRVEMQSQSLDAENCAAGIADFGVEKSPISLNHVSAFEDSDLYAYLRGIGKDNKLTESNDTDEKEILLDNLCQTISRVKGNHLMEMVASDLLSKILEVGQRLNNSFTTTDGIDDVQVARMIRQYARVGLTISEYSPWKNHLMEMVTPDLLSKKLELDQRMNNSFTITDGIDDVQVARMIRQYARVGLTIRESRPWNIERVGLQLNRNYSSLRTCANLPIENVKEVEDFSKDLMPVNKEAKFISLRNENSDPLSGWQHPTEEKKKIILPDSLRKANSEADSSKKRKPKLQEKQEKLSAIQKIVTGNGTENRKVKFSVKCLAETPSAPTFLKDLDPVSFPLFPDKTGPIFSQKNVSEKNKVTFSSNASKSNETTTAASSNAKLDHTANHADTTQTTNESIEACDDMSTNDLAEQHTEKQAARKLIKATSTRFEQFCKQSTSKRKFAIKCAAKSAKNSQSPRSTQTPTGKFDAKQFPKSKLNFSTECTISKPAAVSSEPTTVNKCVNNLIDSSNGKQEAAKTSMGGGMDNYMGNISKIDEGNGKESAKKNAKGSSLKRSISSAMLQLRGKL